MCELSLGRGKTDKNDGTAYANADAITLTDNAITHLFSNIKYQLSEQEVESLFHPGQATTMLGVLKYLDDFQRSIGFNQLWYKDTTTTAHLENNTVFKARHTYITQLSNPTGTFSFRIPLKHIFGFTEDYDKIVYGFTQRLTLVRQADTDAI